MGVMKMSTDSNRNEMMAKALMMRNTDKRDSRIWNVSVSVFSFRMDTR